MKIPSFLRAATLVGSIAAFFIPAKGLAVDATWIGSASDHLKSTGSNWVGDKPAADWSRWVFGSDVVNGTLSVDLYQGCGGLTLTSNVTQDITIGGPQPLILTTYSDIDMSSAAHDLTITTPIYLWGSINLNVGTGRTLTISGGLGEGYGAQALTKNGAGTVSVTAGMTYSGGTTVNDGTLKVVRGALGSGPVVINNGGTLYVNDQTVFWGANVWGGADATRPSTLTINAGGQLQLDATNGYANGITNLYLNGGSVTGGNSTSGYGALFLYNGNEQITASGNTTSTISASIGLTGGNNTITVDGGSSLNITSELQNSGYFGPGGFIKAGNGTLTLTGASSYTQGTTINGGTVVLGVGAVSGGATGLGWAAPTNVVTINDGGVLTGNTYNWLANTDLASGGGNSLSVVVNAGGTLRGATNYITGLGNVTLTGGTIEVSNGFVSGAWNGSFVLGGDITVSGSAASYITTASGAGVAANMQMSNGANSVGGTRTFTVNDVTTSAASDLIVSARLTDGTVVKAGAGTLELAAGATGTGTPVSWQVNVGTLLVDAGVTTGGVTVASGATLGGSGTIGGFTTVNGNLKPGNSPGVLTFTNGLTLNGTTTMQITGATTPGTDFDQVVVSGAATTLGGALAIEFGPALHLTDNTNILLFNFSGITSLGNFSSVTSTGFYAGTWSQGVLNDTWTFDNGTQLLTFSEVTGNLNVVPEPATWALLAFSLTTVMVFRRRRAA